MKNTVVPPDQIEKAVQVAGALRMGVRDALPQKFPLKHFFNNLYAAQPFESNRINVACVYNPIHFSIFYNQALGNVISSLK